MLKILYLSFFLVLGSASYTQESSFNYHYIFKLEGISEPSNAKFTIVEIRELLGVKAMRFNDETDEFTILTHLDYEVEELSYDFGTIGLVLVGDIIKLIIE